MTEQHRNSGQYFSTSGSYSEGLSLNPDTRILEIFRGIPQYLQDNILITSLFFNIIPCFYIHLDS
jgi:hypothetical protein